MRRPSIPTASSLSARFVALGVDLRGLVKQGGVPAIGDVVPNGD
jgi:hypothetical protein